MVEACVSKKQWIFEYHINLTNKIILNKILYSKKNNSHNEGESNINCTTLFFLFHSSFNYLLTSLLFKYSPNFICTKDFDSNNENITNTVHFLSRS